VCGRRRQDVWSATKCPSPRCGQLCDNHNAMTCLIAVSCAAQESVCVSAHRCPQCTLCHGEKEKRNTLFTSNRTDHRHTIASLPPVGAHTSPRPRPCATLRTTSRSTRITFTMERSWRRTVSMQRRFRGACCVVLCRTVFPTSRHPPPPSPNVQFEHPLPMWMLPLLPSPVLWNVDRFRCDCMPLNLISHSAVVRPFECTSSARLFALCMYFPCCCTSTRSGVTARACARACVSQHEPLHNANADLFLLFTSSTDTRKHLTQ
jgi:hypothetical protein